MEPPQHTTDLDAATLTDSAGASNSDSEYEDEQPFKASSLPAGRVCLSKHILKKSPRALRSLIRKMFRKRYNQEPKDLQVKVVERLVRGQNVFFHAGTGFGKTRIAEAFFWLYGKRKRPLYLVLNPLDALGDNQVTEKLAVGISAFNCTAETFTEKTVEEIKDGVYTVLYVSPEIFLNNETFRNMYFSQWFRNQLILKVVDEAHMIYTWGIVESGHKNLPWVRSVQDAGIFRPSYGKMGMRLAATDRVPLLLMSATCPPRHRDLIYANLKISRGDIDYIEGELARPEITILRLPMHKSRNTLEDLHDHFVPKTEVPDSQIPPTLIYCKTRRLTMTALKALSHARGVEKGEFDAKSPFARKYHSNTGPTDKIANISDFAKSVYPVISCTLALGLGQNWTRVRRVFQMGRADAAAVSQIIGRCGRNGQPGLAVFYVEENRHRGKNSVAEFEGLKEFSDDDLMDGLAVTPVCLRIAFTLCNLIGRIPMSEDEDIYVAEKERQAEAGMCACRCSNCEPEASKQLYLRMRWLTHNNFDNALQNPKSLPKSNPINLSLESEGDGEDRLEQSSHQDDPDAPIFNRKANAPPPRRIELIPLAEQLVLTLKDHHQAVMGKADRLRSSDYVDEDDIWRILDRIYTIQTKTDVYQILGCDILPGGVAKLFKVIQEWKTGIVGSQALSQMRAREAATRVEQARTLSRLQKQQSERIEREAKIKEARILTDQKRKAKQVENLEQKETKRRRKEQIDEKKKLTAKNKADQEAQRMVNSRMIASLASGKSMSEVEAEEEIIRSQQISNDNITLSGSSNQA